MHLKRIRPAQVRREEVPYGYLMVMRNTRDIVRSILAEKLACPISTVTSDASLFKDLGADSLDYAELVMEFEKQFNITIPSSEAAQIKTVKQAVDFINKKLK